MSALELKRLPLTTPPILQRSYMSAVKLLENSININTAEQKRQAESILTRIFKDVTQHIKNIQKSKQRWRGGGISQWKGRRVKHNEDDVFSEINHLTELMTESMKKPLQERLGYFLPRARLDIDHDQDTSWLWPILLTIGIGALAGGIIGLLASGGGVLFLVLDSMLIVSGVGIGGLGFFGTFHNFVWDVQTGLDHSQRRNVLYNNRYDIANFIFEMNKKERHFQLIGYYGILMRILLGMEPGNSDDMRDAVIEVIVNKELHTKKSSNDWAYNGSSVKTYDYNKRITRNKAFFERLIYFDIDAYNTYIDHFHSEFGMPSDSLIYTETPIKYIKNIAEFYILAHTYQTCVLHIMRIRKGLGSTNSGLNHIISEYKFDLNTLTTEKTIEEMLKQIPKYDTLTYGSMKKIHTYIEDRGKTMITEVNVSLADTLVQKLVIGITSIIEKLLVIKKKYVSSFFDIKDQDFDLQSFKYNDKFTKKLTKACEKYVETKKFDYDNFQPKFLKLFYTSTYGIKKEDKYVHHLFSLNLQDIFRFIKFVQNKKKLVEAIDVDIPEGMTVYGGGAKKVRQPKATKKQPNPYNIFVGKHIRAGKTMAQAAALWKQTRV